MDPHIFKRRYRLGANFILVVGLIGHTTFYLPAIGQIGRPVVETQAQVNVSISDYEKIENIKPTIKNGIISGGKLTTLKKNLQLRSNEFGIFQRVTVNRAFEIVPIEIVYPSATVGETVVLDAIDGGKFDNGKNVKVVKLNNQGKCSFKFQVADQEGIYRVVIRKGADYKTIQVWMSSAKTSSPGKRLLLNDVSPTGASSATSSPPCGNNDPDGPDDCSCDDCVPPESGYIFNPYTGNTHRAVKDLDVWGSVGEIPLEWMRYFNSRGGWTHSFRFRMFEEGFDSHGQPRIVIQYPEGGENLFTQDRNNPNLWVSAHGVKKRVFQQGNIFFLQTPNGHRYRFEKLTDPAGISYYQLQDFRDSYQNLYRLSYNADRSLQRVMEPAGRFLEVSYEVLHSTRVIGKITSSDGRSVKYLHDVYNDGINAQVRLIGVEYGDGTKASYSYHQSAPGAMINLEHAIDPRYQGADANMKFIYDQNNIWGFVKEERNGKSGEVMATLTATEGFRTVCYPNGRVQAYKMPASMMGETEEYTDGLGRKRKYTYAPVRTITHAYDPGGVGFLFTATDALGRVTTYNKRTIYGNPLEITHPDGSKEKWTRDDLDLVVRYEDELGRSTTYTRDNRHRITRILYPDKSFERFTYNNFGQVLTHTRQNRGVERTVYNSKGLKTQFIDPLGNITTYGYDGAHRLASVTDASGNTTRYEYDERGLLIKLTNPDNSFQSYTYDEFGNRTTMTNEIKNTWTTTYDEFRRPLSMKDPLKRETQYSYDIPGGGCGCSHTSNTPTQITLPSGRFTTIEYDTEWQKRSETVGAGTSDAATTSYEYDLVGNLETVVNPKLKSWTYAYDVRDRKKSATDPFGNRTQWTYDLAGNILVETRPDNGVLENSYDEMDRLVQTRNPNGEKTMMSYDGNGSLLAITDPKKNIYRYEYDLLNRRVKMVYPDGSFEAFAYGPEGNLKTYKTRAGQLRTNTYDSRNREIFSDWNESTPDISRTYDAANRLLGLSSSVSTLKYTYDNGNQLISETQDISGGHGPKIFSYDYNADGLRQNITYASGTKVGFTYTLRNQPSSITENGTALATYTYDLNSNRLTKTLFNQTNTAYSYDAANRTLKVDNQKLGVSFGRFDYGYDNVSRRTFVKRDNNKGDVYTYDAIDQVTGVKYDVNDPSEVPTNSLRSVNYLWDAVGNRDKVIENRNSTIYISNNLNQYSAINDQFPTYSENGNLETFNRQTYDYDAQNRLISGKNERANASFAYDARNRRVKQTINGITTFFYYDGWNLVEEFDSSNLLTVKYIHGIKADEILSKASLTGILYYHYDDLGSVTQLTDTSGDVAEHYFYDIFGGATIVNGRGNSFTSSVFDNRFMYTGREFVQDLDLYDYRNRMYSSDLGRFVQPDPINFNAGDLNIYRYVGNSGVNFRDPSGLINCNCLPTWWLRLLCLFFAGSPGAPGAFPGPVPPPMPPGPAPMPPVPPPVPPVQDETGGIWSWIEDWPNRWSQNMNSLYIFPPPENVGELIQSGIENAAILAIAGETFRNGVTVAELAGAGTAAEVVLGAAALYSSGYVGASIGSAVNATVPHSVTQPILRWNPVTGPAYQAAQYGIDWWVQRPYRNDR